MSESREFFFTELQIADSARKELIDTLDSMQKMAVELWKAIPRKKRKDEWEPVLIRNGATAMYYAEKLAKAGHITSYAAYEIETERKQIEMRRKG